jgi:hypothetical protein
VLKAGMGCPLAPGWGMCEQLSSIKNVYWETYTKVMEMGGGIYITHMNLQWQELLQEQQYTSPP